eukprot:Rmarinus@m.20957
MEDAQQKLEVFVDSAKRYKGLAIVAAGASVFYWAWRRRPKINSSYDVVVRFLYPELFIDRKRDLDPGFLTEDVFVVAVVGFFKRGKTFVVNHLFDCNLPECSAQPTVGIGIVRPVSPMVGASLRVLDTEGLDAPAALSEISSKRSVEHLTVRAACDVADFTILVVNYWGNQEQRLFVDIQRDLEIKDSPGADKMIVIHNYMQIESASELERAFESYVVEKFRCQKKQCAVMQGRRRHMYTYWISSQVQHKYPTYHFVLGRDGAESGRRFNEQTFATIRTLISSSINRATRRDVLQELRDSFRHFLGTNDLRLVDGAETSQEPPSSS